MNLRRTCCSTATITTCTSTEKDDDISRIRVLTDNRASWSCSKYSTDLHTFCNIIRMINLFYKSCSKTDLVTIRTVSMCSFTHKFLLRKFSFQSCICGYSRISSACYTHCLVYISTSWQWVTDRSSKTCCSSTKWFDLRRMVMCLILEVDQPLFFYSVNLDRNYDTTCIDLIRLFLISKLSFLFQAAHSHQCKVHKADKFIFSSFENLAVIFQIFFICCFDCLFVVAFIKLHIF